jgi:bacterioferritin (cytochrome b1)
MLSEAKFMEQLCEAAYVELAGALRHMTQADLHRESGDLKRADSSRKHAIEQARQAQALIEAVLESKNDQTVAPQCCALS